MNYKVKEGEKMINMIELFEEIKNLCVDGLCTDGGHHKQWFLEEILKKLGLDLKKVSRELIEKYAKAEGEDPDDYEADYCYGDYIWEGGIPP